jgi:hypothetical protein
VTVQFMLCILKPLPRDRAVADFRHPATYFQAPRSSAVRMVSAGNWRVEKGDGGRASHAGTLGRRRLRLGPVRRVERQGDGWIKSRPPPD